MPAWTTQSEFQLLLIIINQADVKGIKWPEVAKAMGPDYTLEAVKQKFRKIKAASTEAPGDTAADANGAAPSTPSSRKRKGPAKKKDVNGSGDAEDDDEQFDETPIKKQKKVVKAEDD